jgi:creatinine amidohydrolase/Fe(II)-dependent formamide hydrolase-like protein
VRVGFLLLFVLSALCFGAGAEAAPRSVYLEELTWTELRDALKAGATTIIIPVGATEQSGPHMALGKHNVRVKALAGRIATELGDTLVAPVLAYVPEGNISPPTEHMRFPGTISIPEQAFKSTLEAAARSFRQAGFTHIVLIGDHGGYQRSLKEVAAQLNRDWAGTPVRAHFNDDYYRATETAYVQALRGKGLSDAQIGSHAGTADTSLLLAVDPNMVRTDRYEGAQSPASGTLGDPRPSTAALGQLGVDLIVAQTVAAIRKARAEQHR